ncbi:serine/threonine-protein kinase [Streptacidiphilus jiangxiensis]|uniref:non-specific serine/threonine protein kinase n=1 Tax=Streptacidiphilus jiangxiensis TaxID=235985 RepID=A0A1H7PM85_STRJI|nr:serine/threonine-protein kinase [Streptacidiphilus jiangxiensis]SEL36375.1 Serine/threonine protein kinase [Streptacidiphilus jiangxiensis]
MRKLGRYLLVERLGAGSFATVWKAYDPELDTDVAVKVLAENWAANADVRERFLAEARLLRRIASPRVVRVHDVGVQEDRPYFVMDYVRGGTLADRVGHCDPQEALRLAAEAGYAVQVLHEAGVVHRDVKPSNLLLAAGSGPTRVLVADLGSAKQLADASGLTVTTGTPAYMAPEQAFQTGGFDGRADVYALAVVAYELLTGQKPFGPGGRATALMTDQPTASTLPALPAGTELPPHVALLLRAAMSVEPADRPSTAQAFADALLTPLPQSQPTPRPQLPDRSRRLTLRAVCLTSGAVFTATTLLSWLYR